jgi:signal peptidase I
MIAIVLLIILAVFAVLLLSTLILFGCGKIFKAQYLSLRNAFITNIIVSVVGILFEGLLFALVLLKIENLYIQCILWIVCLVVIIWIVRKRFGTTMLKSIGIYSTCIIFTLIFSAVFALFIRANVVQAFKIPSGSMLNTLLIGDHLLVNKFIFKIKYPKRGDLIVFKYPKDLNKDYIERVVAVGGDKIEIKDKKVYINNDLIKENYVIHNDSRIFHANISPRDNFGPIVIPENSYFVMGDNRDNSFDSRFWGVVDKNLIKGKAFIIYWSWNEENKNKRLDRIGKSL